MIGLLLALLLALPAEAVPSEEQIRESLDAWELVTARRLAEERLAVGFSPTAHLALGLAYYYEEGDLHRAERHLRLSKRHAGEPRDHQRALFYLIEVISDMDRPEESLELITRFNHLGYGPLDAERAWKLMKAGRMGEARAVAQRALAGDDAEQRHIAANALCAIEAQRATREQGYQACRLARDGYEAIGGNSVASSNAALAARGALRFAEAEELARESAALPPSNSNPYRQLAYMHAAAGRGEDALRAAVGVQAWRVRQPMSVRVGHRAASEAAVATVLLLVGDTEMALELADRAVNFPDRFGGSSHHIVQSRARHATLRRAARRADLERRLEQASAGGWAERLWAGLQARLPSYEDWRDRQDITAALSDPRRLRETLRPYRDEGVGAPPWLVGDMVHVLGPGVVQVALDRARVEEDLEAALPYLDAVAAEAALARGRPADALSLASQAFERLPPDEAVLRARSAALAAESARRLGRADEATRYYEHVMSLDPSTVRRLGLALPAEVRTGGARHDVREAAAALGRSPRLRRAQGAFRVEVHAAGEGLQACLLGPHGNRLGCASGEDPRDLVDAFHRHVFALPSGDEGIDRRSLDGTAGAASEASRARMEALLEGLRGPR